MKYMTPVSLMLVALVAFAFAGCGSKTEEPAGSATPAADEGHGDDGHTDDGHGGDGHADEGHGGDGHAAHDHGDHAGHDEDGKTDMEKMKEELAKLSPEDAASAMKQHMCPVTGDMLGVMGAPKKIDVNGQQVWICCSGCKKKLLADPEKYLAKLPKE